MTRQDMHGRCCATRKFAAVIGLGATLFVGLPAWAQTTPSPSPDPAVPGQVSGQQPLVPLPVEVSPGGQAGENELSAPPSPQQSQLEPGSVELVAPAAPGQGAQRSPAVPQRPDMPSRLAPGEMPAPATAPKVKSGTSKGTVSQIDPNNNSSFLTAPISSLPAAFLTALIMVGCLAVGVGVAYLVSFVTGKKISFLGN